MSAQIGRLTDELKAKRTSEEAKQTSEEAKRTSEEDLDKTMMRWQTAQSVFNGE
jgi:hypothetical protein